MKVNLPSYNQIVEYVYEQFLLCYHAPKINVSDLKKLTLFSEKRVNELNLLQRLKPVFFEYKGYRVPVFIFENELKSKELIKNNVIQFDMFFNSFLIMSGWQEWVCENKDKHGRFPYKESLQYKFNFAKVPVVTIYFELLFKALILNGYSVKPKKFYKPLIFTHDIDQLTSGWYEDIGYYLKNLSLSSPFKIVSVLFNKLVKNQDSYFNAFLKMNKIDLEHKTDAINFIMTEKGENESDYVFSDTAIEYLFKSVQGEIGLHPGYLTYNNKAEFETQYKKLKTKLPIVKKVRQHYLKYNVIITNEIHEQLKIEEDYSLGFAEHFGFRNSIATPFYLYNFEKQKSSNVLEIPLYFMDGTIIQYLKGSRTDKINEVIEEIKKLKKNFNINFSILFHNTAFSNLKYKGLTEMYLKLIEI